MPQNFTQKDIVNRKQLLAEYNDNYTLDEDDNLILPSSTPGSNRKPIAGHCLCFDSSNPNAYIQTSIPSSNRYNWRIVIKGEGNSTIAANYRTLYADDSGANIAIRQMSTVVEADVFYLSYIAFVNITTNKVEHLFECEEGSDTVLYDACTGDTATLESVTSISALRVDSRTKEWISDEKNLDNEYHISKCYIAANGKVATNFQDIPFPISLAIRFKTPKWPRTQYTDPMIYWGTGWNSGANYGIRLQGLYQTNKQLMAYYLNNEAPNAATNGLTINNMDVICDNKWHSIVICANTDYLKIYVDGELKGTKTKTYSAISGVPSTLNFRLATVQYTTTTYKDWSHKDLLITNFDMSLSNASYTVADYEKRKDVPTSILLGTGTDKVWLQWHNINANIAYDGSPNKKHMNLYGVDAPAQYGMQNITPSKCYGAFYNQVGGTVDNGIVIPRKVIS